MAALRVLLRSRRSLSRCRYSGALLERPLSSSSTGSAARRAEIGVAAAGAAAASYLTYHFYNRRDDERTVVHRPHRDNPADKGDSVRSSWSGWLPAIPPAAAKETVMARRPEMEDLDYYATSREQRFRQFASVEFEGQLYMTPRDFIESVTTDEPRGPKQWRSLSHQEFTQILLETPPVWKGSSKLFRNLKDKGVISYTEYLFLLCILTKPHAGFKIAFNMFDTDGNQMVDKKEFMVLQEIFRKKNEKKERKGEAEKCAQLRLQLYGYLASSNGVLRTDTQEPVPRSYWDTLRRSTSQLLFSDFAEHGVDLSNLLVDTTLLVHFFGKKGKAELNFQDFYRFMDNLQTELLEIEFLSYSKGMNTVSEEDFAHILLRYTNVENTTSYLENVRHSMPEEKFLNNLEDFTIAMQMYNFANRSIGQDEFKRAVYVATGLKLSPHLVNTVFKIFDVDKDDQLSYKEFVGIMKDRLQRGFRVLPRHGLNDYYVCVKTVTSKHFRELWKQFQSRDMPR
ncbi:calcium uptake protein 3, mitochondrial isoform X2 [Microcaecilia unicolor]|uniref:Calcium uptake protein 3, mitochondrial isoform X2 n=1 Tax=Microcaecilia unicolor TaxID=1415580 RepID=A0A6P7XAZ2_9AMPH|nr:calcium uptake protein 3, mitochondrial isoform X2 [Microcaecilia unicolor]